ncbi:PDR/VanB family oxidoreductase [Bradyrhizobium mercantei]|uniref:PDR/VanB family oxidoreductase n=1 Tax=Bradyrhizobium mercantei TaxID=1904807 RepID=UPI001FD97E99|nr:PDR/VanB family oxidoreductase [Bradyrhizobium mercantei]
MIEVLVKSVTNEAEGINAWELRRPDGGELPLFTAGAHLDLHLSNGMVRSYSLCNSQRELDRYVVAINRDPQSRGGSKFIHDTLKAGDKIKVSEPRNNFPLVEDARHVVFVAGGIGITPIYAMIQRLEELGRSWEIHYSARVRAMCAFRERLNALEHQKPGRVHINFDQEPGGKVTDLRALISKLPEDVHLYCCGPNAMLRAFEDSARELGRPRENVHVEYFVAAEEAAVEGGFTVVLQRSGKSFVIPPGKTILDTLLDHNVDARYSCMQGVCGNCEVKVLDGIPDHRDSVLMPAEKASNKTMMICCSGAKSAKLVLDM